jgi:hypothetical protein
MRLAETNPLRMRKGPAWPELTKSQFDTQSAAFAPPTPHHGWARRVGPSWQGAAPPVDDNDPFSPRCGTTALPPLVCSTVPFLRPTPNSDDIVIIDNLGPHKGIAVRKAQRYRRSHAPFLLPYSPGLNPVEQIFPKLRTPSNAEAGTVEPSALAFCRCR